MAGKKEAKQKAGPRGQTEKNREETGSSTGTKNASKEGGQSVSQKKQPQTKQEQRPEEGAQGQRRVGKERPKTCREKKRIRTLKVKGNPGNRA